MKRSQKRVIAIVLMLVLALLMSSLSAAAGTKYKYKVQKTLKQGKWTAIKANGTGSDTYTTINLYKIKFPSSGYITIKNKSVKNNSASVRFFKYREYDNADKYVDAGETVKIAVDKGTFYLSTNYWSDGQETAAKVKYSFKKVNPEANYSPSTAAILKSGKKKTICFTPDYSHGRWYKIKLTNKKGISVWCTGGESISVYDSYLNDVYMRSAGHGSTRYNSEDLQDAGTYYILIRPYSYPYNGWEYKEPVTVKWK